jgi:hypothetical protein
MRDFQVLSREIHRRCCLTRVPEADLPRLPGQATRLGVEFVVKASNQQSSFLLSLSSVSCTVAIHPKVNTISLVPFPLFGAKSVVSN